MSGPQKVDTEVDPHATGTAATLVANRQSEKDLKLYAGWFCPFVQRTWMTLEELKVPYQYIEINPYHKSKEFLDVNPRGLVPALGVKEGGRGGKEKPLYESNILNEYLDNEYASPETTLFSTSNYEKARQKIWIDHIGSKIIPAFYRLLQHTSDASYSLDEARENLHAAIKTWVLEADPQGPFWSGEALSMVDISLAPWNERLFLIQHYKDGGVGIPFYANHGNHLPEADEGGQTEGKKEEEWVTRWLKWSKAMSERRTVIETLSEREMYLKSYKRYAENTTGSEVGQATRKGEKLP